MATMIGAVVMLAAVSAVELERSCGAGKAAACEELGNRLQAGLGVRRDEARAAQLFRKACRAKNADGCADDARALALGEGQPADPRAALPRLENLCHQGRARACANLGDLFCCGLAQRQGSVRAERLLADACEACIVLA